MARLQAGFLTKRGERIKNWKNRYFVLLEGIMLYFTDDQSYNQFLEYEVSLAAKAAKTWVCSSTAVLQHQQLLESLSMRNTSKTERVPQGNGE